MSLTCFTWKNIIFIVSISSSLICIYVLIQYNNFVALHYYDQGCIQNVVILRSIINTAVYLTDYLYIFSQTTST